MFFEVLLNVGLTIVTGGVWLLVLVVRACLAIINNS